MDAYYLFGTRLGPEDAYRLARGWYVPAEQP